MYKPCSKFEGSFSERRAAFICGGGGGGGGGGGDESSVGLAGQFVYVRDDREEADHFGLCEVEVFKAQGEIGVVVAVAFAASAAVVVGLFDNFLVFLFRKVSKISSTLKKFDTLIPS